MSGFGDSLREGAQAVLDKAAELQSRIRERAYAIWEREGRKHGSDQDHWREAEREIAQEKAEAPKPSAPKVTRSRTKSSPSGEPAKAESAGTTAEAAEVTTAAPKVKRAPRKAAAVGDAAEGPATSRKTRARKPTSAEAEIEVSQATGSTPRRKATKKSS
jgi:Protein of unknown function (DUF2934)